MWTPSNMPPLAKLTAVFAKWMFDVWVELIPLVCRFQRRKVLKRFDAEDEFEEEDAEANEKVRDRRGRRDDNVTLKKNSFRRRRSC